MQNFKKEAVELHYSGKDSKSFGYDTFYSNKQYHIIGHKDEKAHDL